MAQCTQAGCSGKLKVENTFTLSKERFALGRLRVCLKCGHTFQTLEIEDFTLNIQQAVGARYSKRS